jgi:hypothetical protein
MQMSLRELITAAHGMGFGALFLLAFSGAMAGLNRIRTPEVSSELSAHERRLFRVYLIAMAVLAWATVLSGAYVVYPWYRAHPPAGVTDYADFPQRRLLSSPGTAGWHNLGMEWKEHVAWFAPIAITMIAYVFTKYGAELSRDRYVRNVVFGFGVAAFMAAGIAGVFGALINKAAPIHGGAMMRVMVETK